MIKSFITIKLYNESIAYSAW